MKTIANLHNFIDALPADIQSEIASMSVVRSISADEPIYRQGDASRNLYQFLTGSVRICNYTADGKEVVTGYFQPGDCFGEMGLIDGLPRMNHAIANQPSRERVLNQQNFKRLYERYPEISQQLNVMFCYRIRLLYSLSEDANILSLNQRLARLVYRLVYSHGQVDQAGLYVSISHEELGRMLGATRQSVSRELKTLERERSIDIRYGKIYVQDLELLMQKYELLLGQEQLSPLYPEIPVNKP